MSAPWQVPQSERQARERRDAAKAQIAKSKQRDEDAKGGAQEEGSEEERQARGCAMIRAAEPPPITLGPPNKEIEGP